MALLFPRTQVYMLATDTMYEAVEVDASNGLFEADVMLPANLTNTDIEYVFEVYCNEKSTGIQSTVTVEASKNPDDYFTVDTLIPAVDSLSHEGGEVQVTVRFKLTSAEPTPNGKLNYTGNTINILASEQAYTVNGDEYTTTSTGAISIQTAWYGTTVEIVKLGVDEDNTTDSEAQSLAVDARPATPTATGNADGTITDVDETMSWRLSGGTWAAVTGTSVTGLEAGSYQVRVTATDTTFASASQTVSVTTA